MIFGIKIKDFPTVRKFIIDSNERLKSDILVKNPFMGSMFPKGQDDSFFIVMDLTTVYPSPFWLGVIIAMSLYVFKFAIGWFTIPLILFVGTFFWSKYFHFLMFKLGIRKAGYGEDLRLMKQEELIRGLL